MRREFVACVLVGLLVLACADDGERIYTAPTNVSPTAATPKADRVAELRLRGLKPAPLAADGACPVDRGVYAADFPGAAGFGPGGYVAYGRAPVAPAIPATPEAAELSFAKMARQGGHAFEKTIWIVAPGTAGPILVRAIAADGNRATFMNGMELELPGPGTHAEGYVYFPAPGCYTFQVDHVGGTHRITFLVRP